jgi:glycyl-tRNA synthetase beta chain
VIVGAFDPVLLELPSRLLVEAMKKHQRYFPIYREGKLSNQFLVVTNNPIGDATLIAEGNARVLAARFHDARFFYAEDRKKTLEQHGENLQEMTWIRGMGTMADRQVSLAAGGRRLAERFRASEETVEQAAFLCKSDLTTQMVGEFPELQGHVGKLLALVQGASFEVVTAIEEHYLPRSAGDYLPQSPAGRTLSLTERLSLLSYCFEKGIKPTASTDAQGLRRAAVGALQVLLEANVRGDIRTLLSQVRPDQNPDGAIKVIHQEVAEFLQGRLKALLVGEGYATDLVEAVIATSGMDLVHDAERVRALGALAKAGTIEPIRVTFRRAGGLVKEHPSADYDVAGLNTEVEKNLHLALQQLPDGLSVSAMLDALTGLRPVVDRFFEGVLVMSEDPNERRNRLGLLKAVTLKFSSLADFTRLSSE